MGGTASSKEQTPDIDTGRAGRAAPYTVRARYFDDTVHVKPVTLTTLYHMHNIQASLALISRVINHVLKNV